MAGGLRSPPADIPAGEAGAALTIDLGALADNWRLLRDRSAPAECAAAVKADAYGTGIEKVGPALWAAGCRTFFVAHLSEGESLRGLLPEAIIYVLNGLLPGMAGRLADLDLRPVLGSREEIAEWSGAGCQRSAALHVDTGLNRLGLTLADAERLAAEVGQPGFRPSLLMSHFVSSETPGDPVNARQVAAFRRARAAFPGVPASLANSSGIFLPDPPLLDLVRPGYALYGGNPTPGRPNPMRPVVRLEVRIIQTREVAEGETAGYGGRWTAPGPRRLATLSVGYADGLPRATGGTDRASAVNSPTGAALVDGCLCPFVGNVSMDLIVIDVTDAPEGTAERGATVILIGDALDIDEVGRRAGTIGYEVLTSLGRRFARRYVNG